jgi:hypothetical protein
MVYVLSKEGTPLMPCCSAIGRLLLKQGKARVKMTVPFTIVLNYESTKYTQNLTLGVDSGSAKIGSAVKNIKDEIVYVSQVEIRNDISEKMTQRAKYRRNRRNRKTRYRKPRFSHRKNSIRKDRFSPTMKSKFDAHMKEINFVKSILPITKIIIETATFDPHALKNPEVLNNPLLYQQGINYGYANSKAFALHRDGYKCQNRGCKTKDKKIETHHIIFRCNDGSDEPENLITLCKNCHDGVHNETIVLNVKGKKKGNLSHATQMNSIRIQLLKRIPETQETFGYITKEHRYLLGLSKEHYFDAVAIASNGRQITFKTDTVIFKKCIADGDYQLRKGVRSEQVIPVGKIHGFRKFDKVKYKGEIYLIKGRMTTGYAILMDIHGEKANLSPIPKFSKMRRISARKSWMVASEKMTA